MEALAPATTASKGHEYRPCPPTGCRSPCPALNTLANHDYMYVHSNTSLLFALTPIALLSSREGYDLSFFDLVNAIVHVYNLSYALAGFLTLVGFLTCGRLSFGKGMSLAGETHVKSTWLLYLLCPFLLVLDLYAAYGPRFVLDLCSLSCRGHTKISHDGSFVHPNCVSSTAPLPTLVGGLLDFASTTRNLDGRPRDGLGLIDIAHFHAHRLKNTPTALNNIHSEVALGECALTWEVLRGHQCYDGPSDHDHNACLKDYLDGVIPRTRLEQWFGEERLPDGWWDFQGVRPTTTVGLVKVKILANSIRSLARKTSCSSCSSAHASSYPNMASE
ncbi:hypothetical protein CVT26_012396 [Gymnopilus dilepis]|uniref:Heme haloperoxidase family profile domain-containing protein n=1 Tax=Gymnopilus dilepis TaxID=231916 RepID=A0A409YCQ8_9AGAR|nr:hypothetical protein CVT26_012396 [Gymnopilus dilepis]